MRRFFPISAFCRLSSLFLLFFLIHGAGLAARAETLQKYREDIETVKKDLFYLYSTNEDEFDEEWTKSGQVQTEKNFLEKAAQLLPAQETVEWKGITVEVDNRWLHEKLQAIKGLPVDSKERDKIIDDLDGRLAALEAKLNELDSAVTATRSKDEEKQKLEQILKRSEYQTEEKKQEESAIQRWVKAFLDWLRDLLPKGQNVEPSMAPAAGAGMSPVIVQALVFGLTLAVIAFVIWRIVPLLRNRGARKKKKKDKGERVILGEKLSADESSSTLFDQAEQLAREGNFRGAIRKGYIALLCELGDRKIVRIEHHKTNRDYLNDVRKNRELHGGVRDLTFMFENHWYGLTPASDEEWLAFRENYRSSTRVI